MNTIPKRRAYTISQLIEKGEQELAARLALGKWGNWHYDKDNNGLDHSSNYFIPLDQADTPVARANWLWHLWEKNWITGDDIHNLMTAFSDLCKKGGGDHVS